MPDASDFPQAGQRARAMFERTMLRIGAVALTVGLIAAVIFESLHPSREDPNNNPRVFAEYAASGNWTTIHLGALAGALMLIGGLIALNESLREALRALDFFVADPLHHYMETGMLTGIKARAEGKYSDADDTDPAAPAVEPLPPPT
jgi:hypothetical protein